MTGRRAVIGLMLLSALLLGAFTAQSASAAKSINTTAFTCLQEGGSKDFSDEHCENVVTPGTGQFGHSLIPLNETKEVEVTNGKVTELTKKSEPAVLKSKIAGAKVTIECTEVKGNPEETSIHNVESEKTHLVTGEATVEFRKCAVKEPAKCIVAEPIIAEASVTGVEKLGAEGNAMGLEFVGKSVVETFAEIEFTNKGEEKCALNGTLFKVKGSVIGTSGPSTESSQTNKSSGATVVFTPKSEMQKLKLGVETAEFTTVTTLRTPERVTKIGKIEIKDVAIPISLTTTT